MLIKLKQKLRKLSCLLELSFQSNDQGDGFLGHSYIVIPCSGKTKVKYRRSFTCAKCMHSGQNKNVNPKLSDTREPLFMYMKLYPWKHSQISWWSITCLKSSLFILHHFHWQSKFSALYPVNRLIKIHVFFYCKPVLVLNLQELFATDKGDERNQDKHNVELNQHSSTTITYIFVLVTNCLCLQYFTIENYLL